MSTDNHAQPTDEQVIAAIKAACCHVTPQSMADFRAALKAAFAAAPQPAQEPAGRLHADGYFTWKEGRCPPGYERDKLLPCDFYLAAPAPVAELVDALHNLLEAVESMQGTYGCERGNTPEDSDTFTHDEWAEKFLQERANEAVAALARYEEKK